MAKHNPSDSPAQRDQKRETREHGMLRRSRQPFIAYWWAIIKSLLADSFGEWNRQNATRLGASLAFYSLLSLAPLLLLVVSIAGLVFGHSTAQHRISEQIEALVGPAAAKAAIAFLQGSHANAHGVIGTVFSVLTLLFSASGVLIELRDALNYIWEAPVPSVSGVGMIMSFLKERLFSFGMVLSIGFLLIVSLAISTWISALSAHSESLNGIEAISLHVANWLVSFFVITVLFGAIYKLMPELPLQWRDVILGGAVTSLLFTAGKFILGIYLGRASYASIYGAAGSVVILIAWVYYSAQIFFLGAEFTKAFAHRYGSRPNPQSASQSTKMTQTAKTTNADK
jgi:membrane protein